MRDNIIPPNLGDDQCKPYTILSRGGSSKTKHHINLAYNSWHQKCFIWTINFLAMHMWLV